MLTEKIAQSGSYINYNLSESTSRYDLPTSTAAGWLGYYDKIVLVEKLEMTQTDFVMAEDLFSGLKFELKEINNGLVCLHQKNEKILSIKKEGEQERLRKEIGSVAWDCQKLSEKINWVDPKNSQKYIDEIRKKLSYIEDLFAELI
jgi:hypothetical protein